MKVTWGLEKAEFDPKTITTLGSYDGVHLGHQKILRRLAERKQELGLKRSVLLTFHPHPQTVLRRNNTTVELLTTIDERIELLSTQDIDEIIVIEFTLDFAKTSYIDFFRDTIVGKLGTKAMVVGFNHAFGKNREGDAAHLKVLAPELGVSVEEVDPLIIDGISISSTRIRQALHTGDIRLANAYLGRNYSLAGIVVHGDHLGRMLGYPTANLDIAKEKLLPVDGVYAAKTRLGSTEWHCALSIGTRPTVTDSTERKVEAHLIGFDGDLYDTDLEVEIHDYLRPQIKLSGLEELKTRIAADCIEVEERLSRSVVL